MSEYLGQERDAFEPLRLENRHYGLDNSMMMAAQGLVLQNCEESCDDDSL